MKILALLIFLFSINSFAQTSQLSPAGYLRKLSYHIRGIKPSASEYQELAELRTPEEVSNFNQRKLDQYLQSEEAKSRMIFRLSEKFQVLTPDIDQQTFEQLSNEKKIAMDARLYRQNSLSDLFGRMAQENLSWDYLLTGKEYNLFPRDKVDDSKTTMTDFSFFRTVKTDLPMDVSNQGISKEEIGQVVPAIPLRFEPDDLTVAGVLTTPRFLNRYNTTNLNKNRRRAAAVFRIFLCDPMFPIIPPPPDKKSASLKVAFDDVHGGMQVSEDQLRDAMTVSDSQRHGADPKCAACHYKLDPMGRTFQNIGVGLNPEPAKGTLTFARGGQIVKQDLNGIGDLGKAVAQQEEYLSCQINWFWKEFIGEDVVLTPERRNQLTTQFNAVDRRTNDFIKILVTQPEFYQKPKTEAEISFARVQPLLKHCDSCHDSEGYIPYFSDGKIETTTLLRMRHKLNLPEGDPGKMPRDWMKWDPKDLATVKTWIEQGAVDPSGNHLLNADDLRGEK